MLFFQALILSAVLVTQPQDLKYAKFETSTQQEVEVQETKGRSGLRKAIIKASQTAFAEGEITRRQLLKIKLGTLSPAVLEKIEDVAVMQMAASGEDLSGVVEVNSDGKIERASIDWNNLLDFVERLIPIVLQIIQIFA